jgi:hypothetical protein
LCYPKAQSGVASAFADLPRALQKSAYYGVRWSRMRDYRFVEIRRLLTLRKKQKPRLIKILRFGIIMECGGNATALWTIEEF